MEIRAAKPSDAEFITHELWLPLAKEMEGVSSDNALSEELNIRDCIIYREEKILDDESFTLIVENDEDPVGFITMAIRQAAPVFQKERYAKINELYIKESYRRNGLASELLDKTVIEARERGCETIELNVNVRNTSAEQLYKKKGFQAEQKRMVKEI